MQNISKWHVLVGGFLAYLFDAMEIILLTIALPVIQQDLGLSIGQAGMLASATLLGIGFSSITTGWYSDNFGRRKALLLSLVSFGALTMAVASTHDWYLLLLLRFFSGLGLGGVWGIVSAYIAETWPAHQRARATGFVLSSFPVGAAIAAMAGKAFLPDWQLLFLAAGISTLIPVLYLWLFVPESPEWKAQKAIAATCTDVPINASVREIFAPGLLRVTLLGTAAASCSVIGFWGASTWLPTYLVHERGLAIGMMAHFMTILNIGAFIGINAFGLFADRIGKRNATLLSLLGSSVMLAIYALTTDNQVLFWLGPVYAFFYAFASLFASYFSALYPVRVRTIGAGFCFNFGRGLAAFAPLLLSGIAIHHSLALGLLVCAGFFAAGMLIMFFMPQAEAPLDHPANPLKPAQSATS
ncbi:MFS transporter [Pseudomonas alkylphenolica]|uniref:MFS transporter n=1 Tax=Pseudomonas alkylphenolica TaxID=237609 RepID=A0A6I6H882_9PSED|nr:MFS transporter [Pseudomonas alkylphenolica]QGW77514.1 MFS transporter [Pseudomonas alkylphenolica]